ncbi:MAG TPA: dihydrofolate reductase [Acidimicrobiales bacterium]|nr:dihydrofolate reductase [Acidimicrobiales bacterium]
MIRLIAALDCERGIATDTGIPWRLPGDSAYFRDRTRTGTVVMGRGTYEEFPSSLHDRENFVLTSSPNRLRPGFRSVAALADFFDVHGEEEVWVIGGAAVFDQTISRGDELLLTRVQGDFRCTKFFPLFEGPFSLTERSEDREENGISYRFETWRRAKG